MSGIEEGKRELVIRSGRDERYGVRITVQDCGVGIDPREAQRLFTAFYTTKPGGMGMGLAICRLIVEAHGGRLWVVPHSRPGATFQFALPASGEEER
jgi:signal transduction histidine kinase